MKFSLRTVIRWGIVVTFVVAGAIWWRHLSRPEIGGATGEDWRATWVKNRIYASVSASEECGFTRLTPDNANGWHGMFREPIQSFDWYRGSDPRRPTEQRRVVVIQPIGPLNDEQIALIQNLRTGCEAWFGLPVRIEKPLPLNFAPLARRPKAIVSRDAFWLQPDLKNQVDAGGLVAALEARLPPDAVIYLGVTMADLWASNLSYVFGLGSFTSRCGAYSFARYFPEWWNRPRQNGDETQILRRSSQVLLHEAGHVLGVEHCVLYRCVMNGSNSLPDADRTPLEPCPICRRKLQWNLGFEPAKRKRELLNWYRQNGLRNDANALAATN